jgi:hypothetical protein
VIFQPTRHSTRRTGALRSATGTQTHQFLQVEKAIQAQHIYIAADMLMDSLG